MMIVSEETLQETIDRVWESFPPTWNRIRSNIRSIATENFDITVEQFHILRHVRKGIGSVSELADAKQISRSAISQAVDTLVEKGLLTRHQSTEDRRYVRLELTPNGSEMLNTIFMKNREWMKAKMASLSAEEMDTIVFAMETLKKSFLDEPAE